MWMMVVVLLVMLVKMVMLVMMMVVMTLMVMLVVEVEVGDVLSSSFNALSTYYFTEFSSVLLTVPC